MTVNERVLRIENTTHIVRPEDSSIYRVEGVEVLDNSLVFVNTKSGLLFQDLDVFTLEEAAYAERLIQKVKKQL
jgi:hypothetical protein